MEPSDPDFPYEIEALECELSVPSTYPASGKPSLKVRNNDIPLGFQINIEKGFDTIATSASNATLLGLMKQLDKELEIILAGRKAETVKIVANQEHKKPTVQPYTTQPAVKVSDSGSKPFTDHQLNEARNKRASDIRQLEARFGRLQYFKRSSDGLTYTVPLDSPKRSTWPSELQTLKAAQITIPEQYPLVSAEVKLDSQSAAARNVEEAFKHRSKQESTATITQHINYLSQHLKEMSTRVVQPDSKEVPAAGTHALGQSAPSSSIQDVEQVQTEDDRSHIKYIPRPPEWDAAEDSDESSETESEQSEDGDNEDATEGEGVDADPNQTASTAPAERGILLSFPRLELHKVELLELTSLNISVKCERCKDIMDIERLRSDGENSKMREVSCKKCASGMAARFRADLIHTNSVRAGYIDLDGCTVVDMLPRYEDVK